MLVRDFKDQIKSIYNSILPDSTCDISYGALSHDTLYIKYYLAKNSSEVANGILQNDILHIMFSLNFTQDIEDNMSVPEPITLQVLHKEITIKPEDKYMAYSSFSLPYRKVNGNVDKILQTLTKYNSILKDTLIQLVKEDKISDTHIDIVRTKILESINDKECTDCSILDESSKYSIWNSKIKDWYIKSHPEDKDGSKIRDNITFEDIADALDEYIDVSVLLGVFDDTIRMRVFDMLAYLMNTTYDTINNQWLDSNDSTEEDIQHFLNNKHSYSKVQESEDMDIIDKLRQLVDNKYTVEQLDIKLHNIIKDDIYKNTHWIDQNIVYDMIRNEGIEVTDNNRDEYDNDFTDYTIVLDPDSDKEYAVKDSDIYEITIKYRNVDYTIQFKIKDYYKLILQVWDVM